MDSPDSLPGQFLPKLKLYRAKYPNQPILLYKGFSEIIQGKDVVEGNATVLFAWFPYPHAKFEFTHFSETKVALDDFTLKLTELGVSAKAHASETTHYGAGNKSVISGYFCEPVVQGKSQELASLVFYLPNFPFFNISNTWGCGEEDEDLEGWLEMVFDGQFVFQTGDWRLVLATLPDSWDFERLLQSQGGYGLTHACKLERLDRSSFSVDDARDLLKAFSYYISFARGIWLAPILLSGYDAKGEQVFEEWSSCRADSWQNTYIWFSPDSTELPSVFPGFLRKWQDETWRELVEQSIHWYVESSKQAGGVDGAIILQQTALERLAWVLCVEEKRNLSQDAFHKISAADKVRQLLSPFDIGLEIPARLTNLIQLSKHFNWVDGPQAIAEIRNAIVHPNSKNRHKRSSASDAARQEAWFLGREYLELVLLKLFDYPYVLPLEED